MFFGHERFYNSVLFKDEQFKNKSWKDVISNTTKLQLKIIDKMTKEYIGEILLMKLSDKAPELGIQLLQKYHGLGIGTRVMKLFVNKLKLVMQVEFLFNE